MDKIKKLTYKGKQIILINLSDCCPEETLHILPEAKKMIAGLAPKSGLVITNVTHAQYNRAVADAIKDFTTHNSPYLRGSAVIGVEGIQYVLLQTVVFLTRREIKIFPTRLEAQDWLASLN